MRSAAVARVANRAHNSLKHKFASRDFAPALQAVEKVMKLALQGGINPRERHLFPERSEARDSKLGDSARHDSAEVGEVGVDVEREAVKRHPALHPHSQGTDLRLARTVADPDADAPRGPVGIYAEPSQSVDHPLLERMDEAAHVLPALLEVEHH